MVVNVLWTCCEGCNLVLDRNHSTTRLQQVHDKDVTIVDLLWTRCRENILYLFNRSTTFATCSQHVHSGLHIWKLLYVKCKTIPQPLQHVHNKLTIDIQQTNYNTHNKARIPATILQQVHDYCITTGVQQVHNKMILYGNQA